MDRPLQTLLSSLENFTRNDTLPKHAVHPYATDTPDACGLLQDLINTTENINHSLQAYNSSQHFPPNPKLISLMRQQTSLEHTAHSSARNIRQLIGSLSKRSGVNYGESIPLMSTAFPDWCVDQVVAWGTSAGMETFKDDSREGGSATVVLGGKVLVVDVDFILTRENPLNPTLHVSNVKTSNALLQGNNNATASSLLDAFLKDGIEKYCVEMQKPEDERSLQQAATYRKDILEWLRYLVVLDGLASHSDGGIRWFTDLDDLCPLLHRLAQTEAVAVASSLNTAQVPLDIFLLRCHALPLPYFSWPSLSFLAYLSPQAYLDLLRKSKDSMDSSNSTNHLPVDIPLSILKSNLESLPHGVTLATLSLQKLSEAHLYQPLDMADFAARPTFPARPMFPLAPFAADNDTDHPFPQIGAGAFGVDVSASAADAYTWILDFTGGGTRPGVVMSQSRMKAIALVANPLCTAKSLSSVGDVLSFGSGSWVDHLLNPDNTASPERYTALYRSPNNLHPPLQLRLTSPDEPGFTLERIPVHTIKEIWGILEVVREQCWLNEILLGCRWTPEGLQAEEEDIPEDDTVTEADLQAVLSGTVMPRKIPVNVTLPSGSTAANNNSANAPQSATDALFGPPSDMDFSVVSTPKIVMSSPERTPLIAGLVEITVTHDVNKPCGVSVETQGAMGSSISSADLEQICRRGGTLGLSGRVWASSNSSAA